MQKWWPLLSASASFSRSDTGCAIHNFKFSKNKKQACINDNIEARKTFLEILNMYWWQLPMEHPVVVTTWYYSTMLLSRANLITACRTFCFWFNCSSIIPIWNESFSLRSSVWLMEKKTRCHFWIANRNWINGWSSRSDTWIANSFVFRVQILDYLSTNADF